MREAVAVSSPSLDAGMSRIHAGRPPKPAAARRMTPAMRTRGLCRAAALLRAARRGGGPARPGRTRAWAPPRRYCIASCISISTQPAVRRRRDQHARQETAERLVGHRRRRSLRGAAPDARHDRLRGGPAALNRRAAQCVHQCTLRTLEETCPTADADRPSPTGSRPRTWRTNYCTGQSVPPGRLPGARRARSARPHHSVERGSASGVRRSQHPARASAAPHA